MKYPGKEPSLVSTVFFIVAGPILWSAHLLLVYGVQSVTCAVGSLWIPASRLVQASVVLATLFAVVSLLLVLLAPNQVARVLRFETGDRQVQLFSVRVARLLALLSLMGVGWSAAAAFWLDACDQLR